MRYEITDHEWSAIKPMQSGTMLLADRAMTPTELERLSSARHLGCAA